jgi:hypothetical protein
VQHQTGTVVCTGSPVQFATTNLAGIVRVKLTTPNNQGDVLIGPIQDGGVSVEIQGNQTIVLQGQSLVSTLFAHGGPGNVVQFDAEANDPENG